MKRRDLLKRLAAEAKRRGQQMHVTEGGDHSKVAIGRGPGHDPATQGDQRDHREGDPQADGSRAMRVTAKVQRSDDWWAVEVAEVPGVFTQVRRLDQVAGMTADAVATLLGNIAAEDVAVVVVPELPEPAAEAVRAARAASKEAAVAQRQASEAMRRAASDLRNREHLSVRDTAELLGVSHQRVSQLVG
jgi:hypothetical protein